MQPTLWGMQPDPGSCRDRPIVPARRIHSHVGAYLPCRLVAGAAIVLGSLGGCVLRGGLDVSPPTLTLGSRSDASEHGVASPASRSSAEGHGPSSTGNKQHVTTSGYKPTNDIEEIAWKLGIKAVNAELDREHDRCGFTTPVELVYAVPMKEWVGAEGWGLYRGCTNKAETGGCTNLSYCGEVVKMLWFDLCGYAGEGVKTAYKGWNTKVTKIVCRGEAPPPETSAIDRTHSKMKAVLTSDGILTVTLHPSDANVSYDFGTYLEPRVAAD
jgi:hypothetical protein